MNKNKLNLSESEEKFLLRFEKYIENIYINYILIGLLLCTAIVGLIVWIKFDLQYGFFITIFFSGLSVILFIISRSYQKFYAIITKMNQFINEIEK